MLLLLAGRRLILVHIRHHLPFNCFCGVVRVRFMKKGCVFVDPTLLPISCSAMIRCTSLSKFGIGPNAAVDSFCPRPARPLAPRGLRTCSVNNAMQTTKSQRADTSEGSRGGGRMSRAISTSTWLFTCHIEKW